MAVEHTAPAGWRKMLAKAGNPLEWGYVDKSMLMAAISLPFTISYVAQIDNLREQAKNFPNYAPWILDGFRTAELGISVFWAVFLAIGLLLRRYSPDNRVYMTIGVLGCTLGNLPAAYFSGPYISPIWLIVVGTGVAGVMFFPTGIVIIGLALLLSGITAIALATWKGWLPYASFMESPPRDYVGTPDALLWIWTMGSNSLALTLLVISVFGYVLLRWRMREVELARAHADLAVSEQRLSRAAELIRRYVASQVAEQILAGDQASLGRHERRKLTIFFSDIKGFTEASDRMPSEELSHILNEYLSEMSAIATAHGGTLDKFVGDVIMIFFGAPEFMDDRAQALNAVRMAVAMGKRMEFLRAKWAGEGIGFPFQKRVGINTGIVSVGNFGSQERLDYTVIGKQVNLAARLESACEPGKILISHATWALVKDEVACIPKGELSVKGIHHPIKVYEVVA